MKNTKHTGYTLIELMMTLAIMGILATLAMDGLHTFTRHKMRLEAANLLRVISSNETAYRDKFGVYGSLANLQSTGMDASSQYFKLQLDVNGSDAYRRFSLTLNALQPDDDPQCASYKLVADGAVVNTTTTDNNKKDSTTSCL